MSRLPTRARRFASLGIILAFLGGAMPTAAAEGEAAAVLGILTGKVFDSDAKTPLAMVAVRAVDLETGNSYPGKASATDGTYRITDLPVSYYDLVFTHDEAVFVSTRVVSMPASGRAVASFALIPAPDEDAREADWWRGDPTLVPGTDRPADGQAHLLVDDKSFLKTPKGIVTTAGSALLVGLFLAGGGGDSTPDRERASASTP